MLYSGKLRVDKFSRTYRTRGLFITLNIHVFPIASIVVFEEEIFRGIGKLHEQNLTLLFLPVEILNESK